jgi:diguanylate cyclase (GGDEF)-like protein/putative nucleotidyltransferase with HDIG domain
MLRRASSWSLGALTLLFGLLAFTYLFQPSAGLRHVLNVGVYNNVMLAAGVVCMARGARVAHDRLAWLLIGVAVLAWGIGNTVWTFTVANLANPPFPSYADIGFLCVYPPAYVAIVLMLRSRVRHWSSSLWLDGIIGALAVAAVGTAVVFQAVLGALGGSPEADATNLAYPLADLTLVGLVVWALAVMGWRPGRAWALIAAGLLVFSVSDCLYLYETAIGSYHYGSPTDLGWVAGGVLLAWAACQPRSEAPRATMHSWAMLVSPVVFGLLALGVLAYNRVERLTPLALVLAGLSIVGVLARMALAFVENARLLSASRQEASTDPLTGLGNRRRLLDDLEHWFGEGTRALLVLFDLNGFKQYNDGFGHPAGDALLARLGGSLGSFATAFAGGKAYRMGGDEFCLIAPLDRDAPLEEIVKRGCAALAEEGEGFAITTAWGSALLPLEAADASQALRLADQRMYMQKQSLRGTVAEQSSGVLLRLLAERDPQLDQHGSTVASLAAAMAETLGLEPFEVERARLAAALHDIGKMAVPDAILLKPGPLTDDERAFVHRHTLIAERALLSAPSLAHIAGIVRSSHERYDGTGYPDGLAGEDIPLLARVIFVCDAYDAITSNRPYALSRPTEAALAELRRHAGTQFDPHLVSALEAVLKQDAWRGDERTTAAA